MSKHSLFLKAAPFLSRGLALCATVGLSALVARFENDKSAALFFLNITLITAASIFSRWGMDNYIIQKVPVGNAKAILVEAVNFVISLSVLVACIGFVITSWIFDEINYIILALPFFSVSVVFSSYYKSINKATVGLFLETGAIPALFCVLYLAGLSAPMSYFFSGAGISFFLLSRKGLWREIKLGLKNENEVAFWNMLYSVAAYVLVWVPVWMLYLNDDFLGASVFFVLMRVSTLMTIPLLVLLSVSANKLVVMRVDGLREDVNLVIKNNAKIIMLVSGFLVAAISVFGKEVLMIFNDGYAVFQSELLGMAIFQFFNSAFGYSVYMLLWSGESKKIFVALLCLGGVMVIPGYYLVVSQGVAGAVMYSGVMMVLPSVGFAMMLYKEGIGLFVSATKS